jgi:mediator of RNA polymerase II transcription subunit 6
MVGIEYVVHKVLPPHLFIIHKRLRHGEADVDLLASYYVLDGTVYQAPNLLSLLKCRVTSSLAYLNEAIQLSTDNLRYDPEAKAYLTTSDANASNGRSRINAAEARALDAFFSL